MNYVPKVLLGLWNYVTLIIYLHIYIILYFTIYIDTSCTYIHGKEIPNSRLKPRKSFFKCKEFWRCFQSKIIKKVGNSLNNTEKRKIEPVVLVELEVFCIIILQPKRKLPEKFVNCCTSVDTVSYRTNPIVNCQCTTLSPTVVYTVMVVYLHYCTSRILCIVCSTKQRRRYLFIIYNYVSTVYTLLSSSGVRKRALLIIDV